MSADASSEANRDDGCEWYFGVPFPSKRKAAAVQERELKVGDRVKTHGCYSFDPGLGTIVQDCGHYFEVKRDVAPYGIQEEWAYSSESLTLIPPTFPSGTRVSVVRNTSHYAVGDTGTVTVSSDENVGVHMDNGHYWSFKPEYLAVVQASAEPAPDCAQRNGEQGEWTVTTDHNGFVTGLHGCDQRRPANDPATPCIVIRQVDGQPRPSSWPHVHQSAAGATKEAERLASVNPGKQFDVYQRVTGRVGDVQVREVA